MLVNGNLKPVRLAVGEQIGKLINIEIVAGGKAGKSARAKKSGG